jgi:uncharacterized protein YggE
MKAFKYILACTALALGIMFAAMTHTAYAAEDSNRNTISVTGSAVTDAEPDMASVRFELVKSADTAEGARNALALEINSLKKIISGQLIAAKDVKTSGYRINPLYTVEKRKSVLKGYEASVSANVAIKDLNKLSAVIDRSVAGTSAMISGVDFSLQNRELIERRLLGEAVTNAQEKASIVARAGGRVLGNLIHADINSSGGETVLPMGRNMMMAKMDTAEAEPTNLSPGTIKVRTTVSVIFALK